MKNRRRKVKKKRILVFGTILLLLVLVIGAIVYFTSSKKTNNNVSENKVEIKKEEQKKLSMVMVGDALIHDSIYKDAKTSDGYDFKPMLTYIKDIVSNYDLGYYNQETILGGTDIGLSSYPSFNSPYEVGDAMIDAGFNMVSLATNHTLDRGTTAIENSCNYWKNKDVLSAGSYCSEEDRDAIVIKEKNGIKYAMLNYTYGTNGIAVPSGKAYLVNIWPVTGNNPDSDSSYQNYKEQVKADIEKIRDKVDVLFVAMHWGIEYQFDPTAYQKDAANYLSSLGVNVIIGTHPHVIGPVEWINNTLVIYSLGNFISAHEVVNVANRIGLMTSINITKDKNGIKIDNVSNELLYTYYENYTNFKVIPFSKLDSSKLSNYQELYTEYKEIVQQDDASMYVASIN